MRIQDAGPWHLWLKTAPHLGKPPAQRRRRSRWSVQNIHACKKAMIFSIFPRSAVSFKSHLTTKTLLFRAIHSLLKKRVMPVAYIRLAFSDSVDTQETLGMGNSICDEYLRLSAYRPPTIIKICDAFWGTLYFGLLCIAWAVSMCDEFVVIVWRQQRRQLDWISPAATVVAFFHQHPGLLFMGY